MGNRKTSNIKIAVENAELCGKKCDMRTLLKYAIICNRIYSHKTEMRCFRFYSGCGEQLSL